MTNKTNSVVRINFAGGLIGLIFGSHRGKLESVISAKNRDGWNLAEVIPDNPNLILILLRLLLLIVTLGLWTISVGYILVFEKPVTEGQSFASSELPAASTRDGTLRAEPRFR